MKQIIAIVRNVKSNLQGDYGRITSKDLHEFSEHEKKIVVLDKENNLVELSPEEYKLMKTWYECSEGFGNEPDKSLMNKISNLFVK